MAMSGTSADLMKWVDEISGFHMIWEKHLHRGQVDETELGVGIVGPWTWIYRRKEKEAVS